MLVVTLAIMTMQMFAVTGGRLPEHARKELPAWVLALDGWADRLIVVSNCVWLLFAACKKLTISHKAKIHDAGSLLSLRLAE